MPESIAFMRRVSCPGRARKQPRTLPAASTALVVLAALAGGTALRVAAQPAPEQARAERRLVQWLGQPAHAEIREGLVIVDGDIILGTLEAVERAERARTERGVALAQAIKGGAAAAEVKGHSLGYTDFLSSNYLWPASPGPAAVVPYTIAQGSADVTAAIAAFNAIFTGVIQWQPRVAEPDYVEWALTPGNLGGGCFSSVGRVGGKQQVGGAINCTVPVLLHEMGHAVGLYHEQQRADAAGRLVATPLNIDRPFEVGNFSGVARNAQPIGLYDFASIMHYGRLTFSKNRLKVLESVPQGIVFGEAATFSPGDIDVVKRLYGFTPTSVTVTTNPPGLPITVDGVGATSPQTYAWALGSQHTVSVPDGILERAADTSVYQFTGWNDGGARSHTVTNNPGSGTRVTPVARPHATVLQADFQRYDLTTVQIFGNGTIALQGTPQPIVFNTRTYTLDGTTLTVTGTPNGGAQFYRWFGDNPFPQGLNPRPWLVWQPDWSIQGQFVPTQPNYTVAAAFTNPAPPASPANATLFGTMDGAPESLPQNFVAADGWSPGVATRTVAVDDPEVPVTFNVQYDFISWSDAGAASHTLAALPGSNTTYTATFTPTWRGYSQKSPNCASNSANVPDAQYLDGQVVNFSVAPVSGWSFTGWTGAVAGQPNPTSLTVRDQFAVVATFNTIATPLAITSLAPDTVVQGGSNVPLTINGTGFTAGSQVFVNGSFRAPTFVNATRLDITLTGADLASIRGLGILVQNVTASPACSTSVEASLQVVDPAATPPNLVFESSFEN